MHRRRKIAAITTAAVAAIVLALSLAFVSWNAPVAHAKVTGNYPTNTYSSTTAPPTVTPVTTPPTTPPPVVNPFAGCRFSVTQAYTFSVVLGRFVERSIPAILCVRGPWWHRVVTVYDQIGG
jgi:hypothetical protein